MGLFDIVKDIGNAIKHAVVDPLADAASHDATHKIRQVVQLARPPPPAIPPRRPPPHPIEMPPVSKPFAHIDSITVLKPMVVGEPKVISHRVFSAIPRRHTRPTYAQPVAATPIAAAVPPAVAFVSKLESGLNKTEIQIAMVTGGVAGYLGDGLLLGVVGAALPPVAYAALAGS
jgi:hypothetical protein